MKEKFAQTISNVNYNKGIFSLYFVGQESNNMANGIMAQNDNELELKQVIHMPASGFMYMVTMVKSMLEDPRMQAEFDKLVTAGMLLVDDSINNENEVLNIEEKSVSKKKYNK